MFVINRKQLADELSLLSQIAVERNVIPALSAIRFEVRDGNASLLASNADIALFTDLPAEGEDWQGCIPARQLTDLIKLAKADKIVFTSQGEQVQITWGRSRHRLPVIEFAKFPAVQGPTAEGERLSVKTIDFTSAMERVLPCADRDGTMKWMVQGVKLEAKDKELKIVGTNTHRLGVATIASEGTLDLFVPLNAALLLPRLKSEEVLIWHDGSQASFNFGPRTLITRLMTSTFPDWKMFMPKHLPLTATCYTEELIGAFKRANVTREETFKTGVGRIQLGVVLVFGKEELVIDTKHGVKGRSEESVLLNSNLTGDLVYMGINPDYVMDFLRFAGETTECALKDGNSVLRLTDSSNFEYVVVPTRL
jgi:DNA polymerase III beta subunit